MNALIKLLLSFKYAARGILFCIMKCRNFRIDTVVAAYVLYFSRFYYFEGTTLAMLFGIIALVMSLEAVNTAIEQVSDRTSPGFSEHIKRAKDAAAGATLIAAVFSVAVAFVLFYDMDIIPEIGAYFMSSPLHIVLLILSAVASVIYIFYEDIFKNGK